MTWYDTGFKQRQAVAIDAVGTVGDVKAAQDITIAIPSDWDLF